MKCITLELQTLLQKASNSQYGKMRVKPYVNQGESANIVGQSHLSGGRQGLPGWEHV